MWAYDWLGAAGFSSSWTNQCLQGGILIFFCPQSSCSLFYLLSSDLECEREEVMWGIGLILAQVKTNPSLKEIAGFVSQPCFVRCSRRSFLCRLYIRGSCSRNANQKVRYLKTVDVLKRLDFWVAVRVYVSQSRSTEEHLRSWERTFA